MEYVFLSNIIRKYIKGKSPDNNVFLFSKNDVEVSYLTPEYLRGIGSPIQVKNQKSFVWVEDGDIIILWDGSNAGEILKGKNGVLPSTMVKLLIFNDYYKEYVFYLLKFNEYKFKGKTQGSGIPHANKDEIERVKIYKIDFNEQSKIAEILMTIDDAIEKTERIIAKYRHIKQGLLQDLLTKGIDENGNIRSEATHKFKDSPLGRIPVEWKVESISSILVNKEGAIKVGPFGSQLRKDELCENGYKVYGQENAFYKDFNIGKRYINKSKFKQLKSCELLSGDFIISMMGTIGRCAIVPNDIEKGIMDSHLIRLRIKNYNLKLLIYLIEDYHLTKQQIKNMSVGGIMEGLNSKVIKQILIPVLPSKEQEMIVSLLDCCLNVINYEESILNKLKSIKQGLMQDLLSGKVRVTHLLK